jgi:hypothetical protein
MSLSLGEFTKSPLYKLAKANWRSDGKASKKKSVEKVLSETYNHIDNADSLISLDYLQFLEL